MNECLETHSISYLKQVHRIMFYKLSGKKIVTESPSEIELMKKYPYQIYKNRILNI